MVNGLPVMRYDLCTSCGACERACPRGIVRLIPFKAEQMTVVACNSHDPGPIMRQLKICTVGCIGCGLCARTAGDLFKMSTNLAVIDYHKYSTLTDLAPVAAKCPVKVIRTVGPDDSVPVRPEPPAQTQPVAPQATA